MNNFASSYPDDYSERLEAMLEAGDNLRKERRENPCPTCHGEGKVQKPVSRDSFGNWDTEEVNCATCHGWGTG